MSQEVKNDKSQQWVGPWETHVGLLTGTYWGKAPPLPQSLEGRGSVLRYLLEQTVILVFSKVSFLRQLLFRVGVGWAFVLEPLQTIISVLLKSLQCFVRGWGLRERRPPGEEASQVPGWSLVKGEGLCHGRGWWVLLTVTSPPCQQVPVCRSEGMRGNLQAACAV